ncbi:Carboxypeptidase [Balamuthia mandrillaris]
MRKVALCVVLLGLLAAVSCINLFDSQQYHGYIEVNEEEEANLFYWMFAAQNTSAAAPLVLWLTGGPGCSSEVAIFFENGPFKIDPRSLQLKQNPYSWNKNAHLLYVDQPAGTGFSYARRAYVKNETMVALDMYTFLQKFLQQYPHLANVDFYITGESYAGHYIPAIAAYILQENKQSGNPKINLKGIAIGDGLIDPESMAESWGTYLYFNNKIGKSDLYEIQQQFYKRCQPDLQAGDYGSAFFSCNQVLQMGLQAAGNINVYDIREPCKVPPLCYDTSYIADYLNQPEVRKQLGVGNRQWEDCSSSVYAPFESKDFEYSYEFDLPIILEEARVLIYNGNYDLVVDFYGQGAMLDSMQWPGQNGFNNAKNVTWHVDSQVAGSVRTYQNLSYLVVNNAGHMVPHDQPKNALDMLTRFLSNLPFN